MENPLPLRISLGLILVVMLAYSPVVHCDFVSYDDGPYIFNNSHVKTGLTLENIVWAWTSFHSANWHPLTWMSHQLDCQLFDLRPRQHHIVNLFWHIVNTVSLFLVLRRMTGEDWRPALVAGLFGLHPLHVESVAWVAERKDVLSTFFAISALGAYVRYSARPSLGRYLVVATAFALSLLCKPMLVTLPFVLFLLDYWPLRRTPLLPASDAAKPDAPRFTPAGWGRLLWEKVPLLVLSAASSVVTMQAQVRAMKPSEHLSLGYRLGNALVAYATYLRKMVWPVDLAALYAHPGSRLPIRHVAIAAGVLAVLTLLIVVFARRRPAILVGWLWYLGTLVPTIGVVQVGLQAMADRYTYVPLIGIFMALAWCIPPLPESRPLARFLTATLAGIALIICVPLTWRQTLYWRDDPYLWPHVLEVADSPLARCYYAGNLYESGQVAEAEEQCRAALRLDPAFPMALFNLERYLLFRGELSAALEIATQAVSLNPNSGGLRHQLGVTLVCRGCNQEACREFLEACRLEPDIAIHHFCLAAVLARLGDQSGAEQEYREGRRLNPHYLDDARKTIEEYSNVNDPRKNCPPFALFVGEQLLEGSETPQAEMYQSLAKALAANQQPIAAYSAARQALALAESNARADLIPTLRAAMRSYQPLAHQREARALTLAIVLPAISTLPKQLLTLAIIEADLAEHRFPKDIAAR